MHLYARIQTSKRDNQCGLLSHIDVGPVNVTRSVSDPGNHRATISMSTLEPIETRWSLRGRLISGLGKASVTNGDPKGMPRFGPE